MKKQLRNKTLIFEQDYIETEIKWGLKLGDQIFKKVDIENAVNWMKEKIENRKNLNKKEMFKIINLAFHDLIRNEEPTK